MTYKVYPAPRFYPHYAEIQFFSTKEDFAAALKLIGENEVHGDAFFSFNTDGDNPKRGVFYMFNKDNHSVVHQSVCFAHHYFKWLSLNEVSFVSLGGEELETLKIKMMPDIVADLFSQICELRNVGFGIPE